MIKHYFITAWRNLQRDKMNALINLLGLGVAITVCLLITQYVSNEWSYDKFQSKSARLYRPWLWEKYEKKEFKNTVTPFPLGPTMKENLPDVEAYSRVATVASEVRQGDATLSEDVHFVDSSFFDMFDFPLIATNDPHPLNNPNSVIITQTLAKKYFGSENPLGQSLALFFADSSYVFTVNAIAADVPANSSIRFNILLPFKQAVNVFGERVMHAWFNVQGETYVLLKHGVTGSSVEAKLPSMFKQIFGNEYIEGQYNIYLQPITDIHLNNKVPVGLAPVSNPAYSYILATIALFILVIACINFITLSIGRAAGRAREVGVRKTLGAVRVQLIRQFWSEALLMTLLAVVLGWLLAWLAQPFFNRLTGLPLQFVNNKMMLVALVGLVLLIGLLAGAYPALVLSGFKPVEVLKGKLSIRGDRAFFFRSLLVVQFTLSSLLIISTLVMKRQMNYLQNTSLGYTTDLMVNIPINQNIREGMKTVELFRNALAGRPEIAGITAASFGFGQGGCAGIGYIDDAGTYRDFNVNLVDPQFLSTFQIPLLEGRDFSPENARDRYMSIIVNESFVKTYGWSDPLTSKIPSRKLANLNIIGVVKDYHYESMHTPIEPLALVLNPDSLLRNVEDVNFNSSPNPDMAIRLRAGKIEAGLKLLEDTWKAVVPGLSFNYTFIDQTLAEQYNRERTLGRLVTISSGLSIFIACLGLFGLALLAMVRRTKEIGIRKVMGAGIPQLIGMLSKDFLLMVALAFAIASPVAWWAMHRWLADFAYNVGIEWWVFILAGIIALAIAFLTVSIHAARAALANPIKSLRQE